jgi:two-component system, chemotaxis family, response regulator Rcp1
MTKLIEILLVEDNPADVELTMEALARTKLANNVVVVKDGVEAMDYLHCRGEFTDCVRPNLILLDLNMPRKDGREVLQEIKADPDLKTIPVVVLTTSQAEEDIMRSYELHANCYVTKPVRMDQLVTIVQSIENFWFGVVELPPRR